MARKYGIVCVRGKVQDGYEMYFVPAGQTAGMVGELLYEGYAPRMMKPVDNDYIEFNIDIETGRILNWPKFTDDDIERIAQWELVEREDGETGYRRIERKDGE